MIDKSYVELVRTVLLVGSVAATAYLFYDYSETKQKLKQTQDTINKLDQVIIENNKNLEDLKKSSAKTQDILDKLNGDSVRLNKSVLLLTNKNNTAIKQIEQKFEKLPKSQENLKLKEDEISTNIAETINSTFCLINECRD